MSHRSDLVLNLGPQHPSTHGVLRVIASLDGEVLTSAKPDVGYLHRCFEKLAEGMTYPMIMPMTDRTDYVASITNEWAYALAIEKLAGVQVPERAEYIRVIVGELQRIMSHIAFWGFYGADLGAFTPLTWAFRDREAMYDLFESLCGGRLLYNYLRIGGVRNDLPPGWTQKVSDFVDHFEKKILPEYHKLLTGNRIFEIRSKDVGALSKEDAIAYGASGPMISASGVKWDLRKDATYSIYDRFDFEIPTGVNGDCYDRFIVRFKEITQSIRIIRQALEQLPEGDYIAKVPKLFKAPAGEVYARMEGPRGEVGCYIVGDGTTNPLRFKWKAPSFVHLQLTDMLASGTKVADAIVILGSLDIVLGEVDR